ncbi:guanylate kinase [Inquilinus sp. CAU 1745]|uniref:guanylate kinase n=1 Tax=Inquilinus sp. CAU 1745 TaxID=3140369 RepID=UPI00325A67C7
MTPEAATPPAAAGDTHPEIHRRGLMLVLSSPSGAGKTTISRQLLERDENLAMSVSVTTRPMRPGEEEGVDYYFVSPERFRQMVANRELLEHAKVFGHEYGTPRFAVEAALSEGRDVLFDIDWQGTQQLRDSARGDLVSIFVLPPSAEALESRLRSRAQDSEEVIAGRMAKASEEISHYPEYDYIIVNKVLRKSVTQAEAILRAERLKLARQTGLSDFVQDLKNDL